VNACGRPLPSHHERAAQFCRRTQDRLSAQAGDARRRILAQVDKYEMDGLKEMTNPAISRVSSFRKMSEVWGVFRRIGGDPQQLRRAMAELQGRLYAA
jgi:hypothetical protein